MSSWTCCSELVSIAKAITSDLSCLKNVLFKDHIMDTQKIFHGVTLHGLPVQIELQWPFRPSSGGSDWYVVHGTARLADGGELHADVALDLAQTIKEVLPSLDGELAYWVAINTVRKALDDRQLELLKSSKRQPVPVSSRCYSIRRGHFTFGNATPQQVSDFVARKVFWAGGSERKPVLIADPCDALYLGEAEATVLEQLAAAAQKLASEGLVEISGDSARATDALLARAEEFRAVTDEALDRLHAKHAFERA
jgi:hypothetical protein